MSTHTVRLSHTLLEIIQNGHFFRTVPKDDEIATLKKDQAIVFHCHHGGRSKRVGETFRKKGFTNLYNLTGGIDAWAKVIDKTVPVYN